MLRCMLHVEINIAFTNFLWPCVTILSLFMCNFYIVLLFPLWTLPSSNLSMPRLDRRLCPLNLVTQCWCTIICSSSFQQEHYDRSDTPRLPPKSRDNNYCHYCRCQGHTIDKCWHKGRSNAPIATIAHTDSGSSLVASSPTVPSSVASSGQASGSSVTLSVANFEAIVNQVIISHSGNASSSVFSVLPGTSSPWLFDSAYCNYMTPHPTSFTTSAPLPHSSLIHTVDGSTMYVKNIGIISTPSLSLPKVFHMPELSFNLISVGQLCELGYRLIFDFSGVHVQDPRTNQTLGTGCRIGCMFELSSLHLPTTSISDDAFLSSPSLTLWHLRIGHASTSRI